MWKVWQILSLIVCIAASLGVQAQDGFTQYAGARGAAMGGTSLGFEDIHSAFSNSSGLAELQSFSAVGSTHQRFGVADLSEISLAAALPTGSGTFAVRADYYGFELYNEQRFGLAYGRKILDNLNIGAQIHYFRTDIPEYESSDHFTFDLGLQAKLFDEITLAASLFNPLTIERANGERLPTVFNLGLAYRPSYAVLCQVEIEKSNDFPVQARFGLEYMFVKQFYLRAGGGAQPSMASFGLGYRLNNGLFIDAAASWHNVLGITPVVGIGYAAKVIE